VAGLKEGMVLKLSAFLLTSLYGLISGHGRLILTWS